MRVGMGLPNSVPGTEASLLLEWARRADTGPFTSLGVVDRVGYDCHEPMSLLAAVATVTDRVRLVTMVVIAPLRSTAILAKQAAFVDAVSGGRFVLGVAVGARTSDYEAAGVDHRDRGRRLERQLGELRDLWEEGPGPRASVPRGPVLLVGGGNDLSFARAARYADGYVHGGGPPRAFARAAERARVAWTDAGRPGRPALWGQSYFALGNDEAAQRGRDFMLDYYGFTGPFAEKIADGLLTTPQAVLQQVRGYAEAGCDELVLFPAVADLDQLALLANVIGEARVPAGPGR
jgi:alkanesulfonate monooxygenase SsuD/methylene tetrahydromethanopterin reductase-like flavin-dependent oxidoreductase (luciferase family)